MRKSILLSGYMAALATMIVACDRAHTTGYTVVDEVPDGATPVKCRPVRIPGDPAASEIRLASDSTWTLLDAARGEIRELDDRLRVRSLTRISELGPGAAVNPVSVAALGDTAWAVAARGGLRLVLLDRSGLELGAVPLDFIPHSLEAISDTEFLLTAMPFGERPPSILVRVAGQEVVPIPVPRRSYQDLTVNALGNAALVETLDGGDALVIHQFLSPRAFRVGAGGVVRPLRMPTPAGTRALIDNQPRPPITEEQLPHLLVPALAMSVDARRGRVYLLTRSGREVDGRPERAVLLLDETLEFQRAFLLDVPAAGLVYLPRAGMAVVHDDQDRFFTCRLPRGGNHARAD